MAYSLRFCLVMALALSIAPAAPSARADEPAVPQRIVSTNLCLDAALIRLVPRARIRAVSRVAADAISPVRGEAEGLTLVDADAEAIAALGPDLVLADRFGGARLAPMLQRLGLRVVRFAQPGTLEETRAFLRDLGAAVGAEAEADRRVAGLDAALAAARPTNAAQARPAILVYQPQGYAPGAGGLADELITLAGLTNLGAHLPRGGSGAVALETVAALDPDILVLDDAYGGGLSRAQAMLRHPALGPLRARAIVARFPSDAWICGGPDLVRAAAALGDLREAALLARGHAAD